MLAESCVWALLPVSAYADGAVGSLMSWSIVDGELGSAQRFG
jgi:hypothetical protein